MISSFCDLSSRKIIEKSSNKKTSTSPLLYYSFFLEMFSCPKNQTFLPRSGPGPGNLSLTDALFNGPKEKMLSVSTVSMNPSVSYCWCWFQTIAILPGRGSILTMSVLRSEMNCIILAGTIATPAKETLVVYETKLFFHAWTVIKSMWLRLVWEVIQLQDWKLSR